MNSTKKTLMALIFATTAILAYGSFVPLQVSYAIGQEGGQEAPQTQDQDVAQGQGPGNPFTMDRGDWQMKAREYGGAGNLNIQSQFNNQILVQVAVCKIIQSPDSSC
ncbi:MAG: hypothetical protein WBL68_12885 [Nitrososphaeraceae archaeon]